jgi:hypothetical protein
LPPSQHDPQHDPQQLQQQHLMKLVGRENNPERSPICKSAAEHRFKTGSKHFAIKHQKEQIR